MKRIAIIGAGIGGLSVALALKKVGVAFTLYEAAPEIKTVGAGILIANNAMQVFKHLGVHHHIVQQGNAVHEIAITNANFSVLSFLKTDDFNLEEGLKNHAIHRTKLHQILSNAVGFENIQLGKRLHKISKTKEGYQLLFEDGSSDVAQFVIGADGIKSVVREIMFGTAVYRDTKQICWRGVLNFQLPTSYHHQALETWGKGVRFGFVQVEAKQVYWYLVVNKDLEKASKTLTEYTADFNPLVCELLEQTPKENIIKGPLYDLKPINHWCKDNMCLLGDAAHATTPNMGQGACQAVEDAFVLGELLKKYSIEEAFKKYPDIRRAKAHHIVNTSWRIGVLSMVSNPLAIAVRNYGLKYLTPTSITLKQMKKIFQLDKID